LTHNLKLYRFLQHHRHLECLSTQTKMNLLETTRKTVIQVLISTWILLQIPLIKWNHHRCLKSKYEMHWNKNNIQIKVHKSISHCSKVQLSGCHLANSTAKLTYHRNKEKPKWNCSNSTDKRTRFSIKLGK